MKVKDVMEPIKNWLTQEMTVAEAIKVMEATARLSALSTYETCIMP